MDNLTALMQSITSLGVSPHHCEAHHLRQSRNIVHLCRARRQWCCPTEQMMFSLCSKRCCANGTNEKRTGVCLFFFGSPKGTRSASFACYHAWVANAKPVAFGRKINSINSNLCVILRLPTRSSPLTNFNTKKVWTQCSHFFRGADERTWTPTSRT